MVLLYQSSYRSSNNHTLVLDMGSTEVELRTCIHWNPSKTGRSPGHVFLRASNCLSAASFTMGRLDLLVE